MAGNIGGRLDYDRLARLFRPSDRDALAREARRLAGMGYTAADIAEMLALQPGVVAGFLAEREAA